MAGKYHGWATPYLPGLTLSRYHSRRRKTRLKIRWQHQISTRVMLSELAEGELGVT